MTIGDRFLKHVGNVIRTKRRKHGISAKAISKHLKISESTLSRYETGKSDIGARMMAMISEYVKFPMKDYTEKFDHKEE